MPPDAILPDEPLMDLALSMQLKRSERRISSNSDHAAKHERLAI